VYRPSSSRICHGSYAYNDAHDPDDCQEAPCGVEFAFWPGNLVPDPDRDRVLVFYYELWRSPTIAGWRGVGTGIGVWDGEGPLQRPVLDAASATPTLMWDRDEVAYDNAALVVGDDLYAYGCELIWIEHRCRVARVPLADVLDKSAWRYYTNRGTWSADPQAAVPLFVGGAAGTSVFYVPYLDAYLAIYSAIFSDDVVYRVAPQPWGPWSDAAHLFTGRPGWNGTNNYTGHAHPEFAEDGGRVQYVTYAHTTGFLRQDLPLVRVVFGNRPTEQSHMVATKGRPPLPPRSGWANLGMPNRRPPPLGSACVRLHLPRGY